MSYKTQNTKKKYMQDYDNKDFDFEIEKRKYNRAELTDMEANWDSYKKNNHRFAYEIDSADNDSYDRKYNYNPDLEWSN